VIAVAILVIVVAVLVIVVAVLVVSVVVLAPRVGDTRRHNAAQELRQEAAAERKRVHDCGSSSARGAAARRT